MTVREIAAAIAEMAAVAERKACGMAFSRI